MCKWGYLRFLGGLNENDPYQVLRTVPDVKQLGQFMEAIHSAIIKADSVEVLV